MKQALDFISLVPWTIVVMMANVYILYRLVRHFLFKPVQEIFKKRQLEVDTVYSEAHELQEQAQRVKDEYEQQLHKAHEQASEIIDAAAQKAKRQEQEILSAARLQSDSILSKANADAKYARRQAAVQIKTELSDMAVGIARKVVEKEINPADHERLIDGFIRQMQEEAV